TRTYRPLTGDVTCSFTVPPTFVALASVDRSEGVALSPMRSWMSAPTESPSTSRTRLTVTVLPMSSRTPVPDCRLPNSGVAYHELYHGWPAPLPMIRHALPGLSPSDVPCGPNAATLATRSACAKSRLADGLAGLGRAPAVALDVTAGVARAGADEAGE